MPTPPEPLLCPKCGSTDCHTHCASHTCDLVRCRRCQSYGTPDGRRWRADNGAAPK